MEFDSVPKKHSDYLNSTDTHEELDPNNVKM